MKRIVVALCLIVLAAALPGNASPQVDPRARAIAESVLETMGGKAAWDSTRVVSWAFFGGRRVIWDKWTGDVRLHSPEGQNRQGERTPDRLTLMNINTKQGRVWLDGELVTDSERLGELLESGYGGWVNDSYWMFMPYKLLDPGVNLDYVGEDLMADDREADVLQLTFESVGVTPQNRYLVYVARDSNLVEQWSYFANRDDAEPGFTRPWAGWQKFGSIMLATDKGRGSDWDIHVYDEVPEGMFTDPSFEIQ